MQYDLREYTEIEINAALVDANIDIAIRLWKSKDWITYSRVRGILIALIRGGRGDEVGLPQMQYIFFPNTHLYPRFPDSWPDQRMFVSDLPRGRSTNELSWEVATRGEFWSVQL